MKNGLAFLMVFVLCLGMLAGCGNSATEEPEADRNRKRRRQLLSHRISKGPTTMGMVKLNERCGRRAIRSMITSLRYTELPMRWFQLLEQRN